LPERKALVYFSSGVGKTGRGERIAAPVHDQCGGARERGIYPIDARGLVAAAPGGDADNGGSEGIGNFQRVDCQQPSGRNSMASRRRSRRWRTTRAAKALLDDNELDAGIVQAQQDMRSYYILGYYSTNAALDGKYRKVSLSLARTEHAGFKLDYRQGYFSDQGVQENSTPPTRSGNWKRRCCWAIR